MHSYSWAWIMERFKWQSGGICVPACMRACKHVLSDNNIKFVDFFRYTMFGLGYLWTSIIFLNVCQLKVMILNK